MGEIKYDPAIGFNKFCQGLAAGLPAGVLVAIFVVYALAGNPGVQGNEKVLVTALSSLLTPLFVGLANAYRNWLKHRNKEE